MLDLLVFSLDEQRFAIEIGRVERVYRAVALTHVPETDSLLHGLCNVHGEAVPVVNLRKRLGLPERSLDPDDRMLLVNSGSRKLILLTDAGLQLTKKPKDSFKILDLGFAGSDVLVMHDERGLVLICDLEKLLSAELEKDIRDLLDIINKDSSES